MASEAGGLLRPVAVLPLDRADPAAAGGEDEDTVEVDGEMDRVAGGEAAAGGDAEHEVGAPVMAGVGASRDRPLRLGGVRGPEQATQ